MNTLTKIAALTCAAALIVGCNNATTTNTPMNNTKAETADKATYHSPGKPSASVEMNYTLSSERVAVGEAVQVQLSFDNSLNSVQAIINTQQELVLSGSKTVNFETSKSGNADASQIFEVTPTTEGIHLISVIAKNSNSDRAKPMVIRVIAGDKPIEEYLEVNGTLTEDEDGNKIISMPAVEK